MNATATKTIDLGNNESISRGVFASPDGTYLALDYTSSKSGFKTRAGAQRWLDRRAAKRAGR